MPFYSGSGTGIVFNAGTFDIADGATEGEGTLIISSGSAGPVSATSEPAAWLLLLTGATMIPRSGSLRRAAFESEASCISSPGRRDLAVQRGGTHW